MALNKYQDFVGQRSELWTIVAEVTPDGPNKKVHCQCACGREKDVFWNNLKYGKTKSCGCKSQLFKGKDLRGQHFGELKVLKALAQRTKEGNVIWSCRCS